MADLLSPERLEEVRKWRDDARPRVCGWCVSDRHHWFDHILEHIDHVTRERDELEMAVSMLREDVEHWRRTAAAMADELSKAPGWDCPGCEDCT